MRSYVLSRITWDSSIKETGCYEVKVRIGSMEVLKRRNKYHDPCNEDLNGQDVIAWTKVMERVGCEPKHWKIPSQFPYCTKRDQFQNITSVMEDIEETLPPCKSIERLITNAKERKCTRKDKKLWLKFTFQEPLYKEITVLRAYGFQSLVGNAGKSFKLFIKFICI
jgi:hypothetical protein